MPTPTGLETRINPASRLPSPDGRTPSVLYLHDAELRVQHGWRHCPRRRPQRVSPSVRGTDCTTSHSRPPCMPSATPRAPRCRAGRSHAGLRRCVRNRHGSCRHGADMSCGTWSCCYYTEHGFLGAAGTLPVSISNSVIGAFFFKPHL